MKSGTHKWITEWVCVAEPDGRRVDTEVVGECARADAVIDGEDEMRQPAEQEHDYNQMGGCICEIMILIDYQELSK